MAGRNSKVKSERWVKTVGASAVVFFVCDGMQATPTVENALVENIEER